MSIKNKTINLTIEEIQNIEKIKSYDGCVISLEKLEELEGEYIVKECITNGMSGNKVGKRWYTLLLINDTEVEVYV